MAISEELLRSVRERAKAWTTEEYDPETRKEVQALLDAEDPTELVDAFYKDLEFGTGGLRGIMGPGTNRMNRYNVATATQGLANYVKQEFPDEKELRVAIGYDCRHHSEEFARIVAEVFAANGFHAFLYSALRPTPMVSFAIRELGCQTGVMITASHNPKEYNGYKAYWSDGAQMIAPHDKNVIGEVNKIRSIKDVKQDGPDEKITLLGSEMDDKYIATILGTRLSIDLVKKHHDFKVVYTPIHGTGGQVIPRLFREAGYTQVYTVPEQDVVSGDFPTVKSPNPEEPAALAMAIARAKEVGAELVVASDPDADRLGSAVRDRNGAYVLINGNQQCLLYAYYAIEQRRRAGTLGKDPYLVKTIVTTDLIRTIAEKNNVELADTYTGFKWIADVIRKNEGKKTYLGGGEESYGYLWDSFVRDKDSASACLILSEIAIWAKEKGMTILDLLDEIYLEYGYSIEKNISVVRPGRTGAKEIEEMMTKFRNEPLTDLAGSPVTEVLDYSNLKGRLVDENEVFTLDMPTTSNVLQYRAEDGTKLSIRPSGTEPKIKFYLEIHANPKDRDELAKAKTRADERVTELRNQLGI